jgi:hypothetical protein
MSELVEVQSSTEGQECMTVIYEPSHSSTLQICLNQTRHTPSLRGTTRLGSFSQAHQENVNTVLR